MSDSFMGLESLGFKNISDMDIYADEKEKEAEEHAAAEAEVERDFEAEILYDKSMSCPCCYEEFTAKTVRTGKVKSMEADSDLRPRYEKVDVLKYDAIVCPKCGYASLSKYFPVVTDGQKKLIREQISKSFTGIENDMDKYTYDDAIIRHKLALFNMVVKKGRSSEKAFTCLKLAWLYRGKAEEMVQNKSQENVSEVIKEELANLKNAYEGFATAFSNEAFPICGMDQATLMYLLAEIARRLDQKDVAKRWISKVIGMRGVNRRIIDKAVDMKHLLFDKE